MRLALPLLVLTLLATQIRADLSITNPVATTTWTSGTRATITWVPGSAGFDRSSEPAIDLLRGNPGALSLVKGLGTARERRGEARVRVPEGLVAGTDYVVRIGQTFSHAFTVAAGSGQGSAKAPGVANIGGNGTAGTGGSTNTTTPSANIPVKAKSGAVVGAVPVSMAGLVPVVVMAMIWF